jgi:hypothetical protein
LNQYLGVPSFMVMAASPQDKKGYLPTGPSFGLIAHEGDELINGIIPAKRIWVDG